MALLNKYCIDCVYARLSISTQRHVCQLFSVLDITTKQIAKCKLLGLKSLHPKARAKMARDRAMAAKNI